MRFDLTDLRLFLCVLEAGSITGGAARAHLALPSASARLAGMEDAAGTALLERLPRGVRPTAAGDALAHHARLVLGQMAQLRAELDDYAIGRTGTIRLLSNTAAMTELLPDALGSYLAPRPSIAVQVTERASAAIVQAIAGGFADVGIISTRVDAGALQLFPCAVDRLALVVARDSPLAARREIAFRDVVRKPFVGLTTGSPLQEHVEAQAHTLGRELTVRVRVRTFEGLCRMVSHGVGVGIVPATAIARCGRAMAVRAVRLTDPWATRTLAVCVRDRAALPRHARDLVDHLVTAAASPSRRPRAS